MSPLQPIHHHTEIEETVTISSEKSSEHLETEQSLQDTIEKDVDNPCTTTHTLESYLTEMDSLNIPQLQLKVHLRLIARYKEGSQPKKILEMFSSSSRKKFIHALPTMQRASLYLELANAYHKLGQPKKIIKLIEGQLDFIHNLPHSSIQGQLYLLLNSAHLALGQYQNIIDLFQGHFHLLHQQSCPALRAQLYFQVACANDHCSQSKNIIKLLHGQQKFLHSLQTPDTGEIPMLRIFLYCYLIRAYKEFNRFDDIAHLLDEQHAMIHSLDDLSRAELCMHLVEAYHKTSQYEKIIALLKDHLEFLSSLDPLLQESFYYFLANAYNQLLEFPKTIAFLKPKERFIHKIQHWESREPLHALLAEAYNQCDRFDETVKLFHDADKHCYPYASFLESTTHFEPKLKLLSQLAEALNSLSQFQKTVDLLTPCLAQNHVSSYPQIQKKLQEQLQYAQSQLNKPKDLAYKRAPSTKQPDPKKQRKQ